MNHSSSYVPELAKVVHVSPMTDDVVFLRVEMDRPLGHVPGQFVMVSVLGVGESAISVTSGPSEGNTFEMAVRKVGSVTGVLHKLKVGDTLGIRGPFGHGFEMSEFYGQDLVFVCGGLGLVPLRSLLQPVMDQAEKFGNISVVTGCKDPSEVMYAEEIRHWEQKSNVTVYRYVDSKKDMEWNYDVGLVTEAIPKIDMDPQKTFAILCGPPVMYKFVILELGKKSLGLDRVYVDLERRMHCGVGVCGHCQIERLYCCKEGPVFRYSDIREIQEAL